MQGLSAVALLLAVAAAGVAGYTLMQDRSDPGDFAGRLDAVEDQLSRIEARLAAQAARQDEQPPTLMGHKFEEGPGPAKGTEEAALEVVYDETTIVPVPLEAEGEAGERLQKLIDKAVEKKAAQMQTMRNKKPPIDVFAKILQLDDEQVAAVQRDVVRAQHAIKDILEIPAEDGTDFLQELVEVMANGMANPGKDPGRGGRLFGRLMSEKIPGSDETYAARVEGVKGRLRESFKRNWTQEQYKTFEAWQMDPTEVQNVEGSPYKDVERRVLERAQQLGWRAPEPQAK